MRTPHANPNVATRPQFVSVQYGDGQQSFWLAADATLAELAARVSAMDDDHDGAALMINVMIGRPGDVTIPSVYNPVTPRHQANPRISRHG